jgi:hypothetical protein
LGRRKQRHFAVNWAIIASVLAGAILTFDFFTKFIGVIDRVTKLCCAPQPTVSVASSNTDWGGQYLVFAFEDLPASFSLGTIELEIKEATGPTQIGGSQAAQILERTVNSELPATDLSKS